jgi:hypothetical protein
MVNRTTRKRSFNDYQATMEVVPQDTDMEEAELTGKRQKVENAPYRKVRAAQDSQQGRMLAGRGGCRGARVLRPVPG